MSSRLYRCPACQNEVDARATVCSNVACRKPLAFCSHCRDVSTYTLAQAATGKLDRDRYTCDRCQKQGVRCLTWIAGGYCNGLARAGDKVNMPLCALCGGHASDVGRGLIGYAVMSVVGLVLKRRK